MTGPVEGDPVTDEPEIDPNEALEYEGPTIWAFHAYRLDLAPSTAVTIWVEAEEEAKAIALFNETAGAGMASLSHVEWQPQTLAHHLRWLNGHEGDLAAIIQRPE